MTTGRFGQWMIGAAVFLGVLAVAGSIGDSEFTAAARHFLRNFLSRVF